MIQQKVKLARLKTEDNLWSYENIPTIQQGMEFWVNCNTFQMRIARSRHDQKEFTTLMVQTEVGSWVPAEVLEYLSEFQVK